MSDIISCPRCESDHVVKNGVRNGSQNLKRKDCGRQFVS